jgi:glutamate carboxypeptidase
MNPIIRLRDFCHAERAWLVETIEALVRLESPSHDKAAVDRCGAEIARRLEAIGGRVTRVPQHERGDHLRATFDGPAKDGQILLLGHFDTVWPVGQLERMPVEQRDGRLYGPGVFDMKTGIALGMLATRAVVSQQSSVASPEPRAASPRIVMLWTTDEEIGSESSRELIEAEARRSAAVLVLEPSLPGGALKTARKGCGSYEVIVRGIAAHAGIEPEKGASAVAELAQQVLRINAAQDLARGVSINVTQVSGGRASNVIPDEARALVDVRATDAAGAELVARAFRALVPVDSRTTLEVHGGLDRPPLERNAGVAALFERARALAGDLGQELTEGATGGGSDGNFTAALGVPTLDGIGAIGDGAHALHEHVVLDALPDRAALIAALIQSL